MLIRPTMKPRGFVLVAAALAASVPLALQMLRWAISAVVDPKAPAPPPPGQWRRLYRQNRRIIGAWLKGHGLGGDSPFVRELGRPAEQQERLPFPPSEQALLELFATAVAGASPASLREMVFGPEGQFLVRMWLPCLVLYRDPPGILLRRARLGDDDAFENLLRLDKSVISDPVLWRRWHDALNDPKASRRERFRRAIAGRPLKRFGAKTVRVAFAGLLSMLSKREGCEMTGPEIRAWFAAFAVGGHLTDHAMPGGEALTRAIHRNRNWPAKRRPEDPDNKS